MTMLPLAPVRAVGNWRHAMTMSRESRKGIRRHKVFILGAGFHGGSPRPYGTFRKAMGNNSSTENSRMACIARLSATQTLAFGAYSASNWRQGPQGIGPPGARP